MAEDGAFLTNLTLDGVREGAYMLCKHADDLLGHHARQVFREKAASMRGQNSIYYYLKELVKTFGSQQHAPKSKKGTGHGEPPPLVLEAHEFRKLVASDPAFESAIPGDQVDALFHRLEHDQHKLLLHQDFVEFCLLDQDQLCLLLFKYRKHLKSLELTDNEIADTFKRLAPAGSTDMSPELLHSALTRDLDVVLTTGETTFLMELMDSDRDGVVKINDLETLLKDDRAAEELVHPPRESTVVDVKISMSEADEASLRRDGFIQMCPKIQDESNSTPMHLWYRKAPKEEGKPAIANIKYASSSRDTDLVSRGFTCLQQDISRSGAFGKHKYIWMDFVSTSTQMTNEVIDLSLTSGDLSDKHDARLWLPRHRGFKLVPGNLNEKNAKHGVFLWLRRRRALSSQELVDPRIDLALESPRTRTNLHRHTDDLEKQVRKTLRRNCPIDQDCSLNFGRLFEEFDAKKLRAISKQATLTGIETFGIKMNKKDFSLVWDRMNPFAKKQIDVETFSAFLELTDFEIDDVVNTLQRTMTTRFSYRVPNYRLIFQSYNTLGDGKLSRSDFQRIFATNQLSFTNGELSKVIQRFDVNKDGVVDYADFLRYVTGVCDASSRAATRIAEAADTFRSWAIEKQNKKLGKDGNIDSTTAWRLLKPKHGLVDTQTIDRILRQRGTRLDWGKIQLLQVLMAPTTNGCVNQTTFHSFVNHLPKKISTMVYELKKLVGSGPVKSDTDDIYNRLNLEANGKLSLVNFSQQLNTLALEKSMNLIDLKDLAYLVQWTGANCGGDGAVLIDRFLAVIRENCERRNMKSEFVTHYDSPQFLEGVNLLRAELKRCAKTPDGKFNYRVPFRLFDKDNTGQIVLSEFEAAIRELGVDKYLVDQEIKSLMRRFDPNSSGGIDYDEFLRFNLAESSSSSRRLTIASAPDSGVERIIEGIVANERLTSESVEAYCSSMRRMFSIIDKDTTGLVPTSRFLETLEEMSVAVSKADLDLLVKEFAGDEDESEEVQYLAFCDAILNKCKQGSDEVRLPEPPPSEILGLLKMLFHEYKKAQQKVEESGQPEFDMYQAFGVERDAAKCVYISADDFKEVLWAAGVRHPYLREELESMVKCFELHSNSGFSVPQFCKFLARGPSAFFDGNAGSLDSYIVRLHDELQTYMGTGKDAAKRMFTLFSELDADSNGFVEHSEFLQLLQKAGFRHFLSPEDETLLLNFLDASGDGAIAYSEFVAFAKHADEKLNALAEKQTSAASLPSPTKSMVEVTPISPPASPAKNESASTSEKVETVETLHMPVVIQVCRLNKRLQTAFPFAKYFNKYRVKGTEDRVKPRVFEKVLDKFLGRLVEQRVVYNMQEMDVEVLVQGYVVTNDEGSTVKYDLFLKDLVKAQEQVDTQPDDADSDSSSSSSSDEGELSCSSDEDEGGYRRISKSISPMVGDAIKRGFKSQVELETLRSQLTALTKDVEEKKQEKVSEKKLYKLLVRLALRLRNKEVSQLFPCFKTEQYGRELYEVKPFLRVMGEQVDLALAGFVKPEVPAPPPEELPAPAPVENTPLSPAKPARLAVTLAKKIYKCFISAAQKNISGRKLLEKCDASKTGTLTLLEFQTVLRLMGCTLTDSELEEVKTALGDKESAQIDYSRLVQQMAADQKRQQQRRPHKIIAQAMPFNNLDQLSPRRVQSPSSRVIASHQPRMASSYASKHHDPVAAPISFEEAKRINSFVKQFFAELLHMRQVTSEVLQQDFECYDLRGTGFVSVDAFNAVMRKLEISLPADVASTVVARFTSASGETFDYVDFCQVVSPPRRAPPAASHVRPLSVVTQAPSSNQVDSRPTTSTSSTATCSVHCCAAKEEPVAATPPAPQPHSCHSSKHKNLAMNLPVIETESVWKSTEARATRVPSVEASAASGWGCPVCFHLQTKATETCEICAAQNPACVGFKGQLQCAACGFRNKLSARTCDLCAVDLLRGSFGPAAVKPLPAVAPAAVPCPRGWST